MCMYYNTLLNHTYTNTMIVGLLIKFSIDGVPGYSIRKTFRKSGQLLRYWKLSRSKWKQANFFIFRATNPIIPDTKYKFINDHIKYCPYCEEIRDFKMTGCCRICLISIDSKPIKMSNE